MSQSVGESPVSLVNPPVDSDTFAESAPDLRFDLSQVITADTMTINADGLMDMLFAQVDQLLAGDVPLEPTVSPPEPAAVESPLAQPVIPLEAILSPKIGPRDLIPRSIEPPETEPSVAEAASPSKPLPPKKAGNPLWLAVLCSSMLLSAGILCFLFRTQLTQGWSMLLSKYYSVSTPAAKPEAKPKENQDFLNYLQQSLDRLAHRGTETLPSPQVSPSVAASPAPSPSPKVIERVYVPVYPTQSSSTATAPLSPAANPPVKATAPSRVGSPTPAPASPAPNVPNIAAATNHRLLGVLELGDKSAALFEVNGTPSRVEIGQQIGSSGWSLVSISNQEAIVRRNGEVRSIYVGQKF